jgi:membrane-associated phospholipid phosphatase
MKRFLSNFKWSADRYRRFSSPFAKKKWGRAVLHWSNLICASLFYIAYLGLLIVLLLKREPFLWQAIIVPGVFFVLLSVFRKWLNRPRPYEVLEIDPLLKRESTGASFPSRHIFSAFMIAATVSVVTTWGAVLIIPAILLAIIRVIGGVHYPADVIVGAGIALLASILYLI